MIGVTKVSVWSNSVYAEFFWWNYDMPELMLGKISSELEIELAKSTGNRYLYTGLGYHSHGVYKSLKKGFEWWTGREWTNNITKYRYLCKKDDEIKTILPQPNRLVIHNHSLGFPHWVTPVNSWAKEDRYTLTGFCIKKDDEIPKTWKSRIDYSIY